MVFNWHTNAWLVTPNVGLEWHLVEADQRISVLGHIGWSRITSFGESDSIQEFAESVGVYSIGSSTQHRPACECSTVRWTGYSTAGMPASSAPIRMCSVSHRSGKWVVEWNSPFGQKRRTQNAYD